MGWYTGTHLAEQFVCIHMVMFFFSYFSENLVCLISVLGDGASNADSRIVSQFIAAGEYSLEFENGHPLAVFGIINLRLADTTLASCAASNVDCKGSIKYPERAG